MNFPLYNFRIKFLKGSNNFLPDILSLDPNHKFSNEEFDDYNQEIVLPPGLFFSSSNNINKNDLLKEIIQEQIETKYFKEFQKSKPFFSNRFESALFFKDGLIYYHGKIWVPTKFLQNKVILLCHNNKLDGHYDITKIKKLLRRTWF